MLLSDTEETTVEGNTSGDGRETILERHAMVCLILQFILNSSNRLPNGSSIFNIPG
jgi:hypothetical protein